MKSTRFYAVMTKPIISSFNKNKEMQKGKNISKIQIRKGKIFSNDQNQLSEMVGFFKKKFQLNLFGDLIILREEQNKIPFKTSSY